MAGVSLLVVICEKRLELLVKLEVRSYGVELLVGYTVPNQVPPHHRVADKEVYDRSKFPVETLEPAVFRGVVGYLSR